MNKSHTCGVLCMQGVPTEVEPLASVLCMPPSAVAGVITHSKRKGRALRGLWHSCSVTCFWRWALAWRSPSVGSPEENDVTGEVGGSTHDGQGEWASLPYIFAASVTMQRK